MEKSGNLSGCSGAPEWCTPQKITWQWKIDVPLSCLLVFGGVNRFPPSFCGICSEGLLTMKWFIKKFIDVPWFSLFVVYFHQGKLADIRPGNSPEESKTQPNPPGNPRNFGGSKFQSSNPIKSYPPRGSNWNRQGQRQRVGWEMSGDQCDLRPGHQDTRGRMGVFFRSMGGSASFFYIIL